MAGLIFLFYLLKFPRRGIPVLSTAWKLEFVDKDFAAAADAYGEVAGSGNETIWPTP